MNSKLSNFFRTGSQRTMLAKKNIIVSFFVKGISMIISLILVPLTINYINTTQYGIWLTLSSIIAWLSFFDIGFVNGLRNKFGEAKAKGNVTLARKYVSTTYAVLSIVFIIVWIVFFLINFFVNWSHVLNAPIEMTGELSRLALIVVSFFCFQYVLKIINVIMIADQRPAISASFDMLSQLLSLTLIFILTKFTKGSLVYLGFALGFSPVFVLVFSSLIMFSTKYKKFRPSLGFVDFFYAKDLIGLGYKFFIIQVAGIIQFQTTVLIIAQYFGSLQVTNYNIAFRLFGIMNMVFSIALTPLWSAVTDAYSKQDFGWIRKSVKRYFTLWVFIALIGGIVLILSNKVYELWIGKGIVSIDFRISFWLYIYFSIITFGSIYVSVLNGMGAIKIQYIFCIISPILFITISIILVKCFNLGIQSIIIANIAANFNGFILAPLQYRKVFIRGKQGIWVK
jgi:O-antigen/teichoic acid export membrane protein